ncbi:hypothetical protein [Nocardia macrotermitis]|uniref:DNA primase/polymerase bifunctional N-terminal domain-containing protein n=1 Tax=Nocardia macrotermitis TaxID=2585198 RepID=A0A7K0DE33_9NOCA|nr:hypothetical protein [Nocardia macrotermitis]MQY24066.1 hypothetical protein [Nocardia macrotermitis]
MNVEKLRTAEDWVALYRYEFALPVIERGGYVMLPITGRIGVLHLPLARAGRVSDSLIDQGISAPVLARQTRWSFVVTPDDRPGHSMVDLLDRIDIGIPAIGSAIMLPTGLGRWTREGCHWVVPPTGDDTTLPPLSAVITTALAVGGGED